MKVVLRQDFPEQFELSTCQYPDNVFSIGGVVEEASTLPTWYDLTHWIKFSNEHIVNHILSASKRQQIVLIRYLKPLSDFLEDKRSIIIEFVCQRFFTAFLYRMIYWKLEIIFKLEIQCRRFLKKWLMNRLNRLLEPFNYEVNKLPTFVTEK